jgi:hypothetical protein
MPQLDWHVRHLQLRGLPARLALDDLQVLPQRRAIRLRGA